ncbi:hypothetical protein PR202_ga28462 [Eleusine coracana subsp. coracana]|uniref:F-box domain-containing protein n=1 Tax=Eleusine coracana subsp. coracana TaxID=191504 RepID=A0AAV5DHT3_ELECO|nr:hypothetical protein PR202_ga28462 [Eleusine coracana subsp. coracana]
MAPTPLELINDVTAEIFLRLPPDEPEHLFRASLVCKPWLRVISDPDFRRRYRAFHRTPPLLGFLQRRQVLEGSPAPRLTTTTAVPPLIPNPPFRDADALDCHHGRVLLRADAADAGDGDWCFMVWDPLTGEKHRLPEEDAVLIEWLRRACTHQRQPRRGAFTLRGANAIVRYNWTNNCISMINPPSQDVYYIALMEMENGALGFVCIEGSSLYLWSRKVSSEAAAEWVKCRVIKLEGLIHVADHDDDEALVVGSAEGVGIIFVTTGAGLFTLELKSGRVRKVDGPEIYFSILPYMSFYTPDHSTLPSLARTH